jgi:single-strand DNA-binding protein
MASYAKTLLLGNLTRDIEMRHTPGGTAVANAGIAVNERVKKGEEWVDEVNFFDLTFWGKTAEIASQYLSKGSPLFVECRPKQETWEKDGEKKSKVIFVVERMQMLGQKGEGGKPAQTPKPQQQSSASSSGYSDNYEVPF